MEKHGKELAPGWSEVPKKIADAPVHEVKVHLLARTSVFRVSASTRDEAMKQALILAENRPVAHWGQPSQLLLAAVDAPEPSDLSTAWRFGRMVGVDKDIRTRELVLSFEGGHEVAIDYNDARKLLADLALTLFPS